MNIDKLKRANILAKSLIPKVDSLLNMSSVSHKKAMIKGMASRSAEFVEKYSVGIADSANDLKE